MRNRDSALTRHTQNFACSGNQGRISEFKGACVRFTYSPWKVSQSQEAAGAHLGDRDTVSSHIWEPILWHECWCCPAPFRNPPSSLSAPGPCPISSRKAVEDPLKPQLPWDMTLDTWENTGPGTTHQHAGIPIRTPRALQPETAVSS